MAIEIKDIEQPSQETQDERVKPLGTGKITDLTGAGVLAEKRAVIG
jgi:hypothetical protein